MFSRVYTPSDKARIEYAALLHAGLRGRGAFRDWEYPHTLLVLDLRPGMRCLSIGASNCLLSVLLAGRYPEHFVGIDIEPDYARWIEDSGATAFQVMDATAMTFLDETFDRVFSVSVLEHIQDDGDTRAAQEIARVLKPGGRAVLTFEWGPLFVPWCAFPVGGRIYDTAAFMERIVEPSGLELAEPLEYPAEGVPAEAQADIAQWAACPADLFCPAAAVVVKE
ncbi:MAG: hypothetical protein AUJ96_02715 [Armatimonadetes bacterium CG2_30_66_41]|nr:MAG: hypothetical protein AUJ96_02715 [Armatimonadetes bacterium CG2_30_66_41]PIX36896.1 MAG: hypothetical protein COZ57_37105 [Armatimonadetes bacterium CG_4_8_14_3_um_filter_66_20]